MPKQLDLMGVGFSSEQAKAVCGQGDQGLTATGSSSADALTIGSYLNAFSTVAASTGAILSTAFKVGDTCLVFNDGANDLALYPPSGSDINNMTSFTVTKQKGAFVAMPAAGTFIAVLVG